MRRVIAVLLLPFVSALAPATALGQTPDPATAAFGDFTPRTVSGTGFRVINLPAGATSGAITVRFRRGGNITATIIPPPYKQLTYGAATVHLEQPHEGTNVFLGLKGNEKLVVDGTGTGNRWTVTIKPMRMLPELTLPISGTAPAAFRYAGPALAATLTWSPVGKNSGPFISLLRFSPLQDTMIDREMPPYTKAVSFAGDPVAIYEIDAQPYGRWGLKAG